jgi:hypothetical protein
MVRNHAVVEWVYFYPFRHSNFDELWPVNAILESPPSDPAYQGSEELNIFDFDQIEANITAYPTLFYWPSRTPNPSIATVTPARPGG